MAYGRYRYRSAYKVAKSVGAAAAGLFGYGVGSSMRSRKRARTSSSTSSGVSSKAQGRARSTVQKKMTAYLKLHKRGKARVPPRTQARRRRAWESGEYQGKFGKPNPKSGRGMAKYNRNGVVIKKEVCGTVTDPNCVYIMNEVASPIDVITYSVAACLRLLLERAGIRVTAMDEFLCSNDLASPNPVYKIKLNTQNLQTSSLTATAFYNVTVGSTLGLATAAFVPLFRDYSCGFTNGAAVGSTGNLEELVEFILEGLSPAITLSQIKLSETMIDLVSYSRVKIQNRSPAADNSADSEEVSNNPVEGRIYSFNGIPKMKGSTNAQSTGLVGTGVQFFNQIPVDTGVKIFGAAALLNSDFREPPPPNAFYNCTGSAKVFLNPGKIKEFDVKSHKTDHILRFLKKLRIQYGTSAGGYQTSYNIFPSQMIALEDVINVNASAEITIAVENERMLGIMCSTKKRRFMRTFYEAFTVVE